MALTLFQDTLVTLVEADVYASPYEAWVTATTPEKEGALRLATSLLAERNWLGVAVSATQPLAWPRESFTYLEPALNLYVEVTQGTTPLRLQRAVALLAVHLLTYPEITNSQYNASYESISIGPISLTNSETSGDKGKPPLVPASILKAISPLLAETSANHWWRAN